jgi:hypothetical protein
LLERWYLLDDKLSPPAYKLKDPDEDFSKILSRSTSTYDISIRENQEWIDVYTNLADLFLSVLHDKANLKSKNDTSSLHDIQLLSGIEMLFNYATKLSSSGCMCVIRQFDGMNICLYDFLFSVLFDLLEIPFIISNMKLLFSKNCS